MTNSVLKLSVVTVVRNNVEMIETAVKSVLNQDYSNVELIVIDGGSTDGTLEVLQRFGARIHVLRSGPDNGIYDALNKGLALCTGDVVGFLHSDDIYASTHALSRVIQAFTVDDPISVDAVYGDLVYVDRSTASRILRFWKSGLCSRIALWSGWMPPHPSFFLRRQRYRDWGDFNTEFRIAGDYDALLRYLWVHRAKFRYVPEILVQMRAGGVSNRSFSSLLLKAAEDVRAMRRNGLPIFPAVLIKPLRKIPQLWRRK